MSLRILQLLPWLKLLTFFISIPKIAGDGKNQPIELWVHMEWREVIKIFCDDQRQVYCIVVGPFLWSNFTCLATYINSTSNTFSVTPFSFILSNVLSCFTVCLYVQAFIGYEQMDTEIDLFFILLIFIGIFYLKKLTVKFLPNDTLIINF